jgi:uncharacterized membrane protein YgcG
MCSSTGDRQKGQPRPSAVETDLAARLSEAIEELAAAADGRTDCAQAGATNSEWDAETTERLASAWALVLAANPELAIRTARYSR